MRKLTLLFAVLASGTLMAQNRPGAPAQAQASGPVHPVFDNYVQPDVSFDVYFTEAKSKPAVPDSKGFIRRWTLLEPISKQEISSNTLFTDSWLRTEFAKEYFEGQNSVLPKDGDSVTVKIPRRAARGGMGMRMGGMGGPQAPQQAQAQPAAQPEYTEVSLKWHSVDSKRYNVKLYRFAKSLGQRPTEGLFLGVTVVNAPEDMTVRLAAGSNSASMWWVNGQEVLLLSGDRRMVVDDGVSKEFTLNKGANIVRCSVINGPGMSDFCMRFIGQDGKPVTNLTITNK
ncbi:MAG: hypothetical protein MJY58_02325 [Bacteroidaceae bacterium]|nr:hypothetical protein [Bacteroidaceae bacterium]